MSREGLDIFEDPFGPICHCFNLSARLTSKEQCIVVKEIELTNVESRVPVLTTRHSFQQLTISSIHKTMQVEGKCESEF